MAIVGLVALLAGIIFPIRWYYDGLGQLRKSVEEREVLLAEIAFFNTKSNRLNNIIDTANRYFKDGQKQGKPELKLEFPAIESKMMTDEMYDLQHELIIKQAYLKIINERIDNLVRQLRFIFYCSCTVTIGFSIASLFLSILGFRLWYVRVQLPSDRKIRRLPRTRKRKLPPS